MALNGLQTSGKSRNTLSQSSRREGCMRIPTEFPVRSSGAGELEARPLGHAHFWERAMETTFSRGQFLRRGAVAAGGFAGLTMLAPGLARAAGSDPRPI